MAGGVALTDSVNSLDGAEDLQQNRICNEHERPRLLFTARIKQNCQRKCCTRLPTGKALWLVIVLVGIESFVFYEALVGFSDALFENTSISKWTPLMAPIAIDTLGKLFYPIAGIVADVWLGRKRVVHISLWLLWASLILLTITCLIKSYATISSTGFYVLISIVFVVFSVGIGGFETNIIPLGADQLQGASAEELSSYFYWYYWVRQFAGLIGILLVLFQYYAGDSLTLVGGTSFLEPFLGTFVLSIGIIIFVLFNRWLNDNDVTRNPLKLIANVTWYAMTVSRGPPRFRRAFRYGEERKPRFELAKKEFDGIFESEDVENVKTFYQILMVLLPYIFFNFTYGIVYVAVDNQAFNLLNSSYNMSNSGVKFISQKFGTLLNTCGIIVVVPIINFLFSFVCSASLYSKSSLRVKMGVGYIFLFLSSVALSCIPRFSVVPTPLTSTLLLILPTAFLLLSEVFGIITTLEFIYAQSPQDTKGLLIGMYWFILGVSSGAGQVVISYVQYYYTTINDGVYNFGLLMCVVLAVSFGLISMIVYVIVAIIYTNRKRPQPDEDDLNIRAFATAYYSRRNYGILRRNL